MHFLFQPTSTWSSSRRAATTKQHRNWNCRCSWWEGGDIELLGRNCHCIILLPHFIQGRIGLTKTDSFPWILWIYLTTYVDDWGRWATEASWISDTFEQAQLALLEASTKLSPLPMQVNGLFIYHRIWALPESKLSFTIDVLPQLVASLENNAPGPCSTWAFFLSSSQTSWVEMNWNTSVFPQYHCCYQLPVTSTSYQVLSTIAVTNLFIPNKCFVVYFLSLLNTKIHF